MLTKKEWIVKEIERIDGYPPKQRWQEVKQLLYKINPDLRVADIQFQEALIDERNETLKSTGASKSGDMRKALSIPEWLHYALKAFDTENYQKATAKQLWETFPEYRVAREY